MYFKTWEMGAFGGFLMGREVAKVMVPRGPGTILFYRHVVIDGAIDTPFIRENFPERYALKERDGILDPQAIAENYWQLHCQPRSAWTHELDLRPWIEKW